MYIYIYMSTSWDFPTTPLDEVAGKSTRIFFIWPCLLKRCIRRSSVTANFIGKFSCIHAPTP